MLGELPENLQRYLHIALTMNKFRVGESVSIQRLAKEAGVHHQTAKKAVAFFYALNQINLPRIIEVREVTIKHHPLKFMLERDKDEE